MSFHWDPREQVRIGRYLFKWTFLASLVGVCAGTASAAFLLSLEFATDTRVDHPWLLYLLPVGGFLVGILYHYWGKDCERGNNLILEEIHDPKAGVSGWMGPMILLGTVATHLFGGSAGREGTAVQMGGSLAGWLARRFGLEKSHTRMLLMAGISAGFGSIFGTPLAGMLFGLEVLAVGRLRYDALIPCLVASVVGVWTCSAWGVQHTHYFVASVPTLDALLVGKVVLASLAFALVSVLFAETTHALHWLFKRFISWPPARPVVGGLIVIGLVWLVGTEDYLGLGIPLIVKSFDTSGIAPWAFLFKMLFTAVTLGSGFKGGEVTPLFFIGAALGCTLGTLFGVPHDFMAALGFVAVFAGAANTPLACTVMGIELFGMNNAVFIAIACCSSYIWSGHRGIYLSQIVDTPKTDDSQLALEPSLATVREQEAPVILSLSLLVGLARRLYPKRLSPLKLLNGDPVMKHEKRVHVQTVGLIRIYLSKDERRSGLTWMQRVFARPLYADIIAMAREFGLWGAAANAVHAGFTYDGKKTVLLHHEVGYVNTHIFLELIGPRAKLEAFFVQIQPLIGDNRVTTYTEVEHWGHPAGAAADLHIVSENTGLQHQVS